MRPEEALKIWSAVCDRVGVKWCLFKDALLCAEGYGKFSDELSCAQVAIFSADLKKVLREVVPALPEGWDIRKEKFATEKGALSFTVKGVAVLECDVLCPCVDKDMAEQLHRKVSTVRGVCRHFRKISVLLLELKGKKGSDYHTSGVVRLVNKTFERIADVLCYEQDNPAMYSILTEECPNLNYDKGMFSGDEIIQTAEGCYPTFSGYRSYLEQRYADYQSGLYDEVGCGITAEEKAALKEHQKRSLEALAFVEDLSKKYNLRYYLIAGSTLGAVRHGGFIPWDDDIDLGIRVEDIDHFEALVKENLPPQFTLLQPTPNFPYPRNFSKICYNGRCCIDLWPLVPTYKSGIKSMFTFYFGRMITKVHYKKIGHTVNDFKGLTNFMALFMSDKTVQRLSRWNERKWLGKGLQHYINLYSIYTQEKETFELRWLDTPARASFEGLDVPIVGCTEEYLTHLYGNYMWKPAPWNRVSRHVDRF